MHRGGPLIGLAVCDQGQSLASSASQSGQIFLLRVESNSSKMNVIDTKQLDVQVNFLIFKFNLQICLVSIHFLNLCCNFLFFYSRKRDMQSMYNIWIRVRSRYLSMRPFMDLWSVGICDVPVQLGDWKTILSLELSRRFVLTIISNG